MAAGVGRADADDGVLVLWGGGCGAVVDFAASGVRGRAGFGLEAFAGGEAATDRLAAALLGVGTLPEG